MIYLVSGYMRSGTSMMMKSLEAGGIPAIYSQERDKRLSRKWEDKEYHPNSGGFYEMSSEQRNLVWPDDYDGKCMKILLRMLPNLNPYAYRVVMMKRNPEEILSSYESMTQQFNPTVRSVCANYEEIFTNFMTLLRNRRDVESVTIVQYPLEDPEEIFTLLQAEGFPIDPIAAADVWDEEQYRHRAEDIHEYTQ